MQRGAFAGGDDIGGGAGARGFGDFDHAGGAERRGDTPDRFLRLGKQICLEMTAGNGDPLTADILRQQRAHRLDRPGRTRRIVGIGPLHGVIGQRQIIDAARERTEMIKTRNKRKRPRPRQPAIGRLQTEDAAE